MGIFMRNYNKPGKGVDELAPKSEGATLFFEIFFRKFWKFIQINLLYLVALIPTFIIIYIISGVISNSVLTTFANQVAAIVGLSAPDISNPDYSMIYVVFDNCIRIFSAVMFTIFWGMGPATAGVHYIMRNYSREENAFILSDFWYAVKDNFKQSLAVFVIDVVMFFVLFYAVTFYASQTGFIKYLKYPMYCIFLFYTMVHLFLYPLMVRYKLTIGKLYKNAALFSMVSLPFSILVLILLSLLTIGAVYFGVFVLSGSMLPMFLTVYVLLIALILYSLCSFIVSYNAECQIAKHIDDEANVEEKIKAEN